MIRAKSLISSLKSSLLTTKNVFPHKLQQSWDSQFNEQNPKLNYLSTLLETNSIRPYFIQKKIQQLQKQDIYFYMQNKQLFHKLPRDSKQQLIKNPNASAILKFHLAEQIKALKSSQVQKHLIDSFNKQIQKLNIEDIRYCLQVISQFQFEQLSEQMINYYQLQNKIIQNQQSHPQLFIQFLYYLSELKYQPKNINLQDLNQKINQLDQITLQHILFIKRTISYYNIKLSVQNDNKLRQCFQEKRKNFQLQQGQTLVLLLQYYPQSANFINIDCLNTYAYISYLQFFQVSQQCTKQPPKLMSHPIPSSVINTAQTYQFSQIIQKRIKLCIDTPQTLMQSFKQFYTNDLNCIVAIIRYMQKQQKITPQIQSVLEKSLMNKIIHLNSDKAFQEYNIVDVFKVLGYLSVNNLCTINFWKKTLKFVTTSIENSKNYKQLSGDQQKKFVVYLFQIFKNKPFPRQLQDQIINLTLLSLTINRWSIRQILPLTISLRINKIADNQLWFGIEQRINQINFKYIESQSDRKALRKIIYNFNSIDKGSYQFWNQMNRNLQKKQKIQILAYFKKPSTLAHIYLKF